MTNARVVELTEDDLALAASIIRAHGREVDRIEEFAAQAVQCFRIAEALCNARSLLGEYLAQLG